MTEAETTAKMLKLTTVAERWDVSVKYVRKLVWSGQLTAKRFGRAIRVPIEEVERYEDDMRLLDSIGPVRHAFCVQASREPDGYVYFVQAGDDGAVKIGWTRNVSGRLSALSKYSPIRLHLRVLVRGSLDLERSLHEAFREEKIHGEWFSPGVLSAADTPEAKVLAVSQP